MKTGWTVIGQEADVRIAMFKDGDWAYEEAKRLALKQLRDYVAPYLARIEELEADVFRESGALPPLRAWRCNYGKWLIVTAKSKKRARELVQVSRHGFDNDWSECEGHWWYHLALDEAVWKEDLDVHGIGNGSFHRSLGANEAQAILQQHIGAYLTVAPVELLDLLNVEQTENGVSTAGTPYKITTNVRTKYSDSTKLLVECRIDDGFGLVWHPPVSLERQNPLCEVAIAGQWKIEGF